MNGRWPWIAAVIFLLALLPATFMVGIYVGMLAPRTQPAPPTTSPIPVINVPLASADLPAGRKIRQSDIVISPMTPARMLASGADMNKVMISAEQVAGRTLKEPLKANDFFTTDKLYLEGDEPTEPAEKEAEPSN